MKKELKMHHALLALALLVAAMVLCTIVWDVPPHVPLLFGCIVVAVIVRTRGYRWAESLEHMISGVSQSVEALIILMLIGVLMAVWLACGTVPAMMYYGLQIISARYFYVTAFLLCAAAAMALGSWGTAGTLGLAILGIGNALGLPAAITAGAVVSGAYVGDKASPLTDCLNLAAAVAECDIHIIVKRLLRTLWKVLLAVAVLYLLTGLRGSIRETAEMLTQRQELTDALKSQYAINPLLLLPFAAMIVCAVLSVPAVPSIMVGVVCGLVLALCYQHVPAAEALTACYGGYLSQTGLESIDGILSGGGIESMLYTVSLATIALAFGGLMTGTKMMDALVAPVLKRLRTPVGMIALTVCTAVIVNALLPDQYLSIALCGQMFAGHYEEKGVDAPLFANAVSAGAITSALVPWNSCGSYMTSILGVTTREYLPFTWFNLLMPLAMVGSALFLTLRQKREK